MMTIGEEGYLEAARKVMEVSKTIQQGIKQIPELFIVERHWHIFYLLLFM